MRTGHPALQPEALGLVGQRLNMARMGVVGLITMQVDHEAAFGGEFAKGGDGSSAIGHGTLEMRDAAHHVDTHVEGANGVLMCRRVAVETVLGEGDELQVDVVLHRLTHVEQGFDAQKPIIAGVDMAADRQEAQRGGPVAVFQCAGFDLVLGHDLFQLTPEADAFEQRAGGIDPRGAVAEGGIHVEMRIDEGWADEVAAGVDGLAKLGGGEVLNGGEAVALDADVGGAAVGERAAFDDEVEHGLVLIAEGGAACGRREGLQKVAAFSAPLC